ncbi:hypothetical protein CROQUDRAFT_652989 [Cronartium quercuum f. sp. fusiforme G11]|uniref:Zn(2)-C6 fungal-type domain-containing protein n=1 Tax=Cronartium quercuum f. sp. fusiforme G11 TaxID=708437 RepID=A0A9P6NV15_9BASI|nr:hypothetical protein CROQUDRAFT_652989 [Cronartium quercuum f. sp. fusiforme G11]
MSTGRYHPETYSVSCRDEPFTQIGHQLIRNTSSDIPVHPDLLSPFKSNSTHQPSGNLPPTHSISSPENGHPPSPPSLPPDHSPQLVDSPTKKRPSSSSQLELAHKHLRTSTETSFASISGPQPAQDPVPSTSFGSCDLKSDGPPLKPKSTRGTRACTVCRRLKMRCVDAENGPPCKRCRLGKHVCMFEESQRGKKGTKRTDLLARNLQTVEEKLDAVMTKIQTQAVASFPSPLKTSSSLFHLSPNSQTSPKTFTGSVSPIYDPQRSDFASQGLHHLAFSRLETPSGTTAQAPAEVPSGQVSTTSTSLMPESTGMPKFGCSLTDGRQSQTHLQIMDPNTHLSLSSSTTGPVNESVHPPPVNRFAALPDFSRPSSPRLHSLPDNTLNPLGLLAEASLRSRHDRHRSDRSSSGSHRRTSSARSAPSHPRNLSALDQHEASHYHISEEHVPLDVASSPSSSNSSLQESTPATADEAGNKHHKRKVGVANQSYFQPAQRNVLPLRRIVIEQQIPPSLLTDKILSSDEAVELFQIFFDKCNPHCCILERDFHTPTIVGSRSPFLFTAVCAVASRYYDKRKDLHLNCLQSAKRIAFDVMVKGYKSVEVVQAFLLLTLWNQPAERFEEDRTWAFSGIAIRMAIDLNLHRKTTAQLPLADTSSQKPIGDDGLMQQHEIYEKEILNRERTWLYCFILDRSLSAQMGKPYSIREDFIIRSSKNWHKHRCSVPDDSGITAMVDLHRIHSRILDTLYSDTCSNSGLNANLDYSLLMKTFSQSLDQWMTECTIQTKESLHDLPGGYRHSMKGFYYNYYRLFTMSFMLQHTLENPDKHIELPQVYVTCYDAATRVITIARDHLGPLGALRYAPDNQFVYIAYAAVFLLKLIRPQFRSFCDALAVKKLVHDCTLLLENISIDETHTPALYAAFLKVLLNSKKGSSPTPNKNNGTPPTTAFDDSETRVEANNTGSRIIPRDTSAIEVPNAHWPLPPTTPRETETGQFLINPISGLPFQSAVQMDSSIVSGPPAPIQAATCGMGTFEPQMFEGFMSRDHPVNDYFADLLKDGGFWESMLMPGYSGPLDALSGGVGLVSQFGMDQQQQQQQQFGFGSGFGFTPTASGRATPNPNVNGAGTGVEPQLG